MTGIARTASDPPGDMTSRRDGGRYIEFTH